MTYFDYAATTFPLPEGVHDMMDWINRTKAVNPGRGSYQCSREAMKIVEDTRSKLAALFSVDEQRRIILLPSATIAMNQILGGIVWKEKDVVYVSPYEHNAVLRPLEVLRNQIGFTVYELPLEKRTMRIDLEKMKDCFLLHPPSTVCCTHISNVTGYILPVREIVAEGKKYHARTIIDASQSAGLLDINIKKLRADYLVFAGHKTMCGPVGVGGFVVNTEEWLLPVLTGGTGSDSLNERMPESLPGRYEAGSKSVVAIGGLNAAVDFLREMPTLKDRIKYLTDKLAAQLKQIPGVVLYLPERTDEHIGIISFNISRYNAEEVSQILDDDYNIAVRSGYHCAARIHKYLKDEEFHGTVRASIGVFTTEEEIQKIVSAVRKIAEE